jgi:hypothetical protein
VGNDDGDDDIDKDDNDEDLGIVEDFEVDVDIFVDEVDILFMVEKGSIVCFKNLISTFGIVNRLRKSDSLLAWFVWEEGWRKSLVDKILGNFLVQLTVRLVDFLIKSINFSFKNAYLYLNLFCLKI